MAKKKKKTKATKKDRIKQTAEIVGFIAVCLGILASVKGDLFSGSYRPPYISYSDCVPYWASGNFSFDDAWLDTVKGTNIEVDKAFAIRSFIKNPKQYPVRVENVEVDIISLDIIQEEDFGLFSVLSGNMLKIFALNNGWGNSIEHNIDISFSKVAVDQYSFDICDDDYSLSEISTPIYIKRSFDLEATQFIQCAEFVLDPIRFQKSNLRCVILRFWIDGVSQLDGDYIEYYPDTNQFGWAGKGEGDLYFADLFSILDVESKVNKIRFTSPKSTPQVDANGTYAFHTVIAPTKSCRIKCNTSFQIDGDIQKTALMEIKVNVPVYDYAGFMLQCIADLNEDSVHSIVQIKREYEHNPQDLQNFNTNGEGHEQT